uniref:Uncharacterized protein n=1 Tax=Ditylenchus dipsaci TaxID=166011 RepID=A0A915DRV9_9BILA
MTNKHSIQQKYQYSENIRTSIQLILIATVMLFLTLSVQSRQILANVTAFVCTVLPLCAIFSHPRFFFICQRRGLLIHSRNWLPRKRYSKYWRFLVKSVPVDGLLGLHLGPSKYGVPSAVEQFAGKLDQPVVTVCLNGTKDYNGTAQLTFGSETCPDCGDNSGYVPLLNTDKPDSYNFLINATGAIFNSTSYFYHTNCAGLDYSQVTLNIGEKGNAKVVLTGSDYIRHSSYDDTCYWQYMLHPIMLASCSWETNF